jgi:hypothetical protein
MQWTIAQLTLAKFSPLDTRFLESLDLVITRLCGCREIYSKYIISSHEPTNFSRQNSYTALKVYTRSIEQDGNREIRIYKKFEELDRSHPGRKYVRTMLDSFFKVLEDTTNALCTGPCGRVCSAFSIEIHNTGLQNSYFAPCYCIFLWL